MRDLKRIQFTSVDKPRIDIECAGHVLSSAVIQNAKKNPNFSIPVKSFDVVSIVEYMIQLNFYLFFFILFIYLFILVLLAEGK